VNIGRTIEMQNVLNRQDELDRENMALYAYLDAKPGAAKSHLDASKSPMKRAKP